MNTHKSKTKLLRQDKPELLAEWNNLAQLFYSALKEGLITYEDLHADKQLVDIQEHIESSTGKTRIKATLAGVEYIKQYWLFRLKKS